MKSTESLDDTGKLVVLSSAAGETAMPFDTSIIENKRRRLVRGAVAFAPLVLTLRSGALAAASCTGIRLQARVVNASNPNGRLNDLNGNPLTTATNPDLIPGKCVAIDATDFCPTAPSKIKTIPVPPYGVPTDLDTNDNGRYRCRGQPRNQLVAILSTSGARSLTG
jgi:hypothetical protein